MNKTSNMLSNKEFEEILKNTRTKVHRVKILNAFADQIKKNESERAVLLAQEALSISNEQLTNGKLSPQSIKHYSLEQALSLTTLCYCLRNSNQGQDAECYGLKAIKIYERYGDVFTIAKVQYLLAFYYYSTHNNQKAIECYQNCYDVFEKSNDAHWISSTIYGLGNVIWRQGDYQKAREYYQRSIDIAKENKLENDLAVFLVGMGNLLEDRSQFSEAIVCYNESISISRKLYDYGALAPALLGMSGISKILGDYSKAITYAEEAKEKYEIRNNQTGVTHCLEILSGIFFEQGSYEKAIRTATEIINLLENTKHRRTLAGALNNLGGVYAVQRNFKQSIEKFQMALDIYTEIEDRRGICFVNSNIAEQYSEMKEWKTARNYVVIALDIAKENDFIDLEIEIIPVLGNIAIAEKAFDEAMFRFSMMLEKCTALKHRRGSALLNLLAGNVEKARHEYLSAVQFYRKAIQFAKEVGDKPLLSALHYSISQVYELIDDPSAAILHFKEYHCIEKEIFNENSDKRIKNLQVTHETETALKERNIFKLQSERLKAENDFKTKELSAMALHLVQKNEMLESIRVTAQQIINTREKQSIQLAQKMIRQIEINLRDDNSWVAFQRQFTRIHSSFTRTLTDTFPNLTPMELKICLLLKIQLNTKEIASILIISNRTVEDHRNRMRKKFGLSKNENLSTFILGLE